MISENSINAMKAKIVLEQRRQEISENRLAILQQAQDSLKFFENIQNKLKESYHAIRD